MEKQEDITALTGKVAAFPHAWAAPWIGLGMEPAVSFHPHEHGIKRPGTYVVSMVLEFFELPLVNNLALTRVMQDVHLPEAKEYFVGYFLYFTLHMANRSR